MNTCIYDIESPTINEIKYMLKCFLKKNANKKMNETLLDKIINEEVDKFVNSSYFTNIESWNLFNGNILQENVLISYNKKSM